MAVLSKGNLISYFNILPNNSKINKDGDIQDNRRKKWVYKVSYLTHVCYFDNLTESLHLTTFIFFYEAFAG